MNVSRTRAVTAARAQISLTATDVHVAADTPAAIVNDVRTNHVHHHHHHHHQ